MATTSARAGGGYENALVGIMFFAAGIAFLDRFGIAFAFPYIGPDLGLSNQQLGATMAVTAATWAVSSVLVAILSDWLGGRKKWLIVGSIAAFSLCTGLVAFATSFGMLLLIRGIMGVVEGPLLPLIQSAVIQASSPHRRGRNLGVTIAGTSVLGNALSPLLVVGLAESFGWRQVFVLTAIPGFVVALLVALIMRERKGDVADAEPAERLSWAGVRAAARNWNVVLSLIGATAMIGFAITIVSFAPLFLARMTALSPGRAATVLTVYGLLGAVGAIATPALSDRIGRKPAYVVATIAVVLVPLALVAFASSFGMLLAAMLLQLLAGGALTLVTYVIPGESVPKGLASTTFAVLIAVGELVGGAIGPWAAGALADAYDLRAALYFCSGLGAVALATALLVRETAPRRRGVPPLAVAIETGLG